MSESENPVLRISGTVTEQDYKRAVRAGQLHLLLKMMIIYVLFCVLFRLGYDFYCVLPYLRSGEVTFGEWLSWIGDLFVPDATLYVIFVFFIVYAVNLLLVRPMRAGKRMRELFPEGLPVVYEFFNDRLVINASGQSGEETVRLNYANVQRRIGDTKNVFTLSTGQKNRYNLFKAVMTPEETARVRELLQARCPQRRRRS